MSQPEVSRFVSRALDDKNLRAQLEQNPGEAFQGYDLTDEERSAIESGDEERLRSIGIDPMTSRSWQAFHDVKEFAPDMPDAPGDVS